MSKNTAYIIGGGGGKIGFAAGVVYALRKKGIIPSVISGVSSGNLVGIMVATGQIDKLKDLMYSLTDNQVIKKRGFKYFWKLAMDELGLGSSFNGMYDNSPLQNLLENLLLGKETICDFYTGVVNIETDTFHHIHFSKGTILEKHHLEFIRASTSIPFIFSPVDIKYKDIKGKFVDGGVHHNVPIEPASEVLRKKDSIDELIIISMNVEKNVKIKVKNDLDMAPILVNGILSRATSDDLNHFEFVNKVAEKFGNFELNGVDYRYYPGRIFRPMRKLSDPLRFHHKFLSVDFVHGYKMAEQ